VRRLLDIGHGTGWFAFEAERRGAECGPRWTTSSRRIFTYAPSRAEIGRAVRSTRDLTGCQNCSSEAFDYILFRACCITYAIRCERSKLFAR